MFRCLAIHVLLAVAALAVSPNAFGQEDDPPFSTSDTNVGYIDSAIPATQFRLRFDSAHDNPLPDRAEFFYRAAMTPHGDLPLAAETGVDYQDVTPYLELAVSPNASAFIEIPFRWVDPELNVNTFGLGDIQVGFKRVVTSHTNRLLTFQFRTYIPTGAADRRLGTDHVSLEPGLLFAQKLSPRTTLESELRLWIPIEGTEFPIGDAAGPVLRYGLGFGHDLYRSAGCGHCLKRLTGVAEFVGWSIFDGLGTVPAVPSGATRIGAGGDTIVNAKWGLRWTDARSSMFVGYGHGLTNDVWYQDIVRAEYVVRF